MIRYNPKAWLGLIFNFRQADTFKRLLPLILFVGAYTLLVAWLELYIWHLQEDSSLKNLGVLHTLMGFALSMLLVFRTNTAYERWWEGRRLWGAIVNNSRSLALKLNALLPEGAQSERAFFSAMIPNFAFALKNHLRKAHHPEELESCPGFDPAALDADKHMPLQIAARILQRLTGLQQQGALSREDLLLMNPELLTFTDAGGACERIRNTPIPYSYSAFLKKFIFFYVMTMPFGYVFVLKFMVVPVVMFIFYVLTSLELIAEEIENPFGTDTNDLPTDQFAQGIRRVVRDFLVGGTAH